jgi:hypothetical protein
VSGPFETQKPPIGGKTCRGGLDKDLSILFHIMMDYIFAAMNKILRKLFICPGSLFPLGIDKDV